MKIRDGFVSNSSASSFLILRNKISPRNLEVFLKENSESEYSWYIEEEAEYIYGRTDMDNFNAVGTLKNLGVREEDIIEREYGSEGEMLLEARSVDTECLSSELSEACQDLLDSIREKYNLSYSDDFDCPYLNKIDKILKNM